MINEDNPSYKTEVTKLPFIRKCPYRFMAIKFLKKKMTCLMTNEWPLFYVFSRLLKTNDANSK